MARWKRRWFGRFLARVCLGWAALSAVVYVLAAFNVFTLEHLPREAASAAVVVLAGLATYLTSAPRGWRHYIPFEPLARVTTARVTFARRLMFGTLAGSLAGIVAVGALAALASPAGSLFARLSTMAVAAIGMVGGVVAWAQRWQGTRNLGQEAWLHVAESASSTEVSAAVKWPVFIVGAYSARVGLDPAHIRSRIDPRDLRTAPNTVFDAEGRRLSLRWHSQEGPQFDILVEDRPPDPEALAHALRGALGIDPYVRPLLPLQALVEEMVRIDGIT